MAEICITLSLKQLEITFFLLWQDLIEYPDEYCRIFDNPLGRILPPAVNHCGGWEGGGAWFGSFTTNLMCFPSKHNKSAKPLDLIGSNRFLILSRT